jgi:hypothetical protein
MMLSLFETLNAEVLLDEFLDLRLLLLVGELRSSFGSRRSGTMLPVSI